ncbi:MAG: M1 family metallopeptidase [Ichthyobacteriaceae bacterium]|nr:M1 family metallopeptidase [Ichthyobacteriaceae bacterium]
MNKIAYIIYTLLLFTKGYSQPKNESNDFDIVDRYINIDTVYIDININPIEKKVSGNATISFSKLRSKIDSFFIHGVNLNITEITLNNKKANYKHFNKLGIWVYTDKIQNHNNILRIKYWTKPKKGMYFTGWNDKTNRRNKQFWTQGQGIDNRHWFPSYDLQHERAIYDLKIGFPENYKVLSNGKLISKQKSGNNIKWHYQTTQTMSSYLVMIAGGEYEVINDSINNIPLEYWHYSNSNTKPKLTYYKTKEIFDLLETEIGVKYPWYKYAQIPVSDFKFGAMENTTATILSDTYCSNDTSFIDINYLDVNAHEMAHQWFGNLITAESSKHFWVHEGFATYYQLQSIKYFFGEGEYLENKEQYRNAIFKISKKNNLPVAHPKAGTERFYYKGAFVIEMLKNKIGEENFKNSVTNFVTENKFKSVDTYKLISSFEKSTGIPLDNFFKQWIFEDSEPEINIDITWNKNKSTIIFNQTEKLFNIDIPLTIHQGKNTKQTNYKLNNKADTLIINGNINLIEVDSKINTLAKYIITKPIEMWKYQAIKGSSWYSKKSSLSKLRKLNENIKIKLWKSIIKHNNYYKVNAEIFKQSENIESKKSVKITKTLLKTTDVNLRKFIVLNTDTIQKEYRMYYEEYLNSKSYKLIASSLNLLCKSFPKEAPKYLYETKNIGKAIIPTAKITWFKNAIIFGIDSNEEKLKYANKLVDYTSSSFEMNTRLSASYTLFEIGYFPIEFKENMKDASKSFNWRLTQPAKQILEALENKK